jgi:hypothetical protein
MRYVDLNPHRAETADSLKAANHTSIQMRLPVIADRPERVDTYLAALASGPQSWHAGNNTHEPNAHAVCITFADYINLLKDAFTIRHANNASSAPTPREQGWLRNASLLRKQQRAYGAQGLVDQWLQSKNMRRLEVAF